MGLEKKPVVKATVRPVDGEPAPVLRKSSLDQAATTAARARKIEAKLDQWYADSQEAMAVVVAPVQYSLILWGTCYGWLIFNELPDLWTWIGTAVIVATGIYTLRREYMASRHTP